MTRKRLESFSCATSQGGRSENEDRFVNRLIRSNGRQYRVMAVFDGHGGVVTASHAASALVSELKKHLYRKRPFMKRILRAVMLSLHELTQNLESGSTATVVCIPKPFRTAFIAVLGDSPVLVFSPRTVFIGPSHNVGTNTFEREQAVARGAEYREHQTGIGYIGNGRYGLQVSRALGDKEIGALLNREPEIVTRTLYPSSSVLVASDGLKKATEPEQAWLDRMVALERSGADAGAFVEDGLHHHGGDNVTAIVWRRR